jgi:hypothetical protein
VVGCGLRLLLLLLLLLLGLLLRLLASCWRHLVYGSHRQEWAIDHQCP